MLAYRLRHRIAFEYPLRTEDTDTGDTVTTWQPAISTDGTQLDSVPAEVLTGPGNREISREWSSADTKNAQTAARINCRWFPGIDPAWRIRWDNRIFAIQSIETDLTGRQDHRMTCVDGPTEGA